MVVVPAPMSMTAAPRSASSSASAESPATYGLATIASTSRWQRSIASIRLRATEASAVTTCMSMPKLARQHAARVADAAGVVEHIADRQRVQHGASGAHRMAAAGGEHAVDVAFADRGAGDLDRGRDQLAGRAPGGHRDDHRVRAASGRCARRGRAHWRTAASASARSITVPAFMPRASVWPKPMTSTE